MAQVRLTLALLAILAAATAVAAPAVPDEGLRAEMAHRWQDALDIYRKAVDADPSRVDLLLRMADIENAQKHPAEAARLTDAAAQKEPQDAALQQRASQAYAVANEPRLALAAIDRALALEPDNSDYLRARADLALWNGDLAGAERTLERVVDRNPGDTATLLKLAQTQSRAGHLDAAVETYGRYERLNPKDTGALLEHARTNMYRGAYAAARVSLDEYRQRAGETEEYKKADAELYARANRPNTALQELKPLLETHPSDYELHLLRTLALNSGREPGEAMNSLSSLDQLGPARPETTGTHLQVETPLRHAAIAYGEYYGDTSGLGIGHELLRAALVPGASTKVGVQADHWRLGADSTQDLQGTDGTEGQDVRGLQAFWHQQLLPSLAVDLAGGVQATEINGDHKQYLVDAQWWASDRLWLKLAHSSELVLISPRTVQLGIERTGEELSAQWQPTLSSTVDFVVDADRYDDGCAVADAAGAVNCTSGNSRRQVIIGPRTAVIRSESHVMDVGLRLQWIHFDRNTFGEDDPATAFPVDECHPNSATPSLPQVNVCTHGYYAPDDFRRLWLTDFYYYKHSDNAGVGVMLALGPERDMDLDSRYRLGGEARVEGIVGIFRDWQLRGSAGYGGRTYAEAHATAYRGYTLAVELTRRF